MVLWLFLRQSYRTAGSATAVVTVLLLGGVAFRDVPSLLGGPLRPGHIPRRRPHPAVGRLGHTVSGRYRDFVGPPSASSLRSAGRTGVSPTTGPVARPRSRSLLLASRARRARA